WTFSALTKLNKEARPVELYTGGRKLETYTAEQDGTWLAVLSKDKKTVLAWDLGAIDGDLGRKPRVLNMEDRKFENLALVTDEAGPILLAAQHAPDRNLCAWDLHAEPPKGRELLVVWRPFFSYLRLLSPGRHWLVGVNPEARLALWSISDL